MTRRPNGAVPQLSTPDNSSTDFTASTPGRYDLEVVASDQAGEGLLSDTMFISID